MNKVIKKSISNRLSKRLCNQGGMTMLSMIIVVVFLLFQGVIAMNVIPVYLTDSSIKDILKHLPNDHKAQGLSAKALHAMVMKRFRLNSIYDIDSDVVVVKKGRGENIVTVEYEPRGKLVGNLDYIVSFKHKVRVSAR
jgi:hypothetical protein